MSLYPSPLAVMLVDDHAVVRTGYRMLLELDGSFVVVGEVENGEEATAQYMAWRPDVVIMDLNLPGVSGLEATRRILATDPEARILIFSIHDESIYVSRAFDAGAKGYLCKSCDPVQMIEAIRVVGGGGCYPAVGSADSRSRSEKERLRDPVRWLSAREFEVFQLLGKGGSSREIGQLLNVSAKTVSNYTTIIKEKLALNSTAELVNSATHYVSARRMDS